MTEFLSNLIGNNYLATAIMSLIPMIELKGGIVFAYNSGIHIMLSFVLAYVGSTIVFFPIYWLLRPILNLLKKIKWFNGLAVKVESYFERKADQTLEKQQNKKRKRALSEKFIKQLGVFIFVAIPLPLTGIWTGTAIAVFLNLKFKDAILPAVLGNAVAGLLIVGLTLLCQLIGINLDWVLYALFGLAIILLIITIVKISLSKPKNKQAETETAETLQPANNIAEETDNQIAKTEKKDEE